MGETHKRLRRWFTAFFDLKDVFDLIRVAVSVVISGGLAESTLALLGGDPLWLQIVYLTGIGLFGFAFLMIGTNLVRGRPIPKWRDRPLVIAQTIPEVPSQSKNDVERKRRPSSREPVLRLQEVVQNGRAVSLLCEFVEASLLPAVNAETSAGSYLGSFIKKDVVEPLKRSAEEWLTASRDVEGDPVEARQVFLNMYKAWHDLRSAVDKCRQILDVLELGHL